MIPPGWNVTEPIELAVKLVNVLNALSTASQDSRAFVSKIDNFNRSLSHLQKKLDHATLDNADDRDHLRATLAECKVCVERCEDFNKDFAKLNNGSGSGKLAVAGQATKWVWQEGKASKLRKEIDSQMKDISFFLLIKSFGDNQRMGDHEARTPLSNLDVTNLSLPELADNVIMGQQHQRLTPAQLLGLDKDIPESSPVKPIAVTRLLGHDVQGLAELESESNGDVPSPLPMSIQSTNSSDSYKILASPRLFSSPDSCKSSRPTSWSTFDSPSSKMTMDNLKGVKISYYKSKDRVTYPINKIEYFHDRNKRLRYILLTPPASFDSKFHQRKRPIPHCEHPKAYSKQDTFRVKFLGPQRVTSQMLSSGHRASSISSAPVEVSPSSPVSLLSTPSPTLTAMMGKVKVESDRLEYDFENEEDYLSFQERAMGGNHRLCSHKPIPKLAFKGIEGSKISQCEMQYLRLWNCGTHQTIMFFANMSSTGYKEYKMEYFRPLDSKSKTELKFKIHWPSLPSRDFSIKSPTFHTQSSPSLLMNQPASAPADEIGADELRNLDCVIITFTLANDKIAFLDKAVFFGIPDDALIPPLELE